MGVFNILLVSDDEASIDTFLEAAEELGYGIDVHRDGLSTLLTLYGNPWCCDILIADEDMPDLPGSRVIEKFLAVRQTAEVVLLIDRSDAEAPARARAAGICSILSKPITVTQVKRRLHKHVRRFEPIIARGEVSRSEEIGVKRRRR